MRGTELHQVARLSRHPMGVATFPLQVAPDRIRHRSRDWFAAEMFFQRVSRNETAGGRLLRRNALATGSLAGIDTTYVGERL